MTKAAGKTGVGPTVSVAIEQHFPKAERLIDDGFAYWMVPAGMRMIVRMTRSASVRDWFVRSLEKPAPGIWAGMMMRKRYIDEKLVKSVGEVDVVLNLGAGLDTRLYRLPALASTPSWEVDQPDNIAVKRRALENRFGRVPAHVTLVPVDFDRDDLESELASAGYPQDVRAFIILEAVTQYLGEGGIASTFTFLSHAASGSRLVFTYVAKSFLDGSDTFGQEDLRRKYVEKDRLWLWGLNPDEVSSFLGDYGWRILEHPTYEELARHYVVPESRALASTPLERMVFAEKL